MSSALSPHYHETREYDTVFASPWSLDKNALGKSLWPFRPWYADIQRGDVVVLRKPHDPEGRTIKRVVGLPGDTIIRVRKRLEVNKMLARKFGYDVMPKKVVVPPGHIWVEGDSWRDTHDSNDFGPVSINLVTGRASQIIWPRSRWGPIPQLPSEHSGKTRIIKGKGFDAKAEEAWKEIYNYE